MSRGSSFRNEPLTLVIDGAARSSDLHWGRESSATKAEALLGSLNRRENQWQLGATSAR